MAEKLDKTIILSLLAEADIKWFKDHTIQFDYRQHLEATADYVVKNYNRRYRSSHSRRR